MARTLDTLWRLARAATAPFDPRDPDGLDPVLVQRLARPVDTLCRVWFGLEVGGLEHLPAGKALVVGNHNSGSTFVEALGVGARFYAEGWSEGDAWHGLAHDAIIGMPILGGLLHRIGALQACHESADAAFARGRTVAVFPGGNREAYRPFRDRYRVDMGDRRGFVRLALRHEVPIVPLVLVGGHSGFVVLHDGRGIARRIRADRWLRSETWPLYLGLPTGVFLGPGLHVPLPVKVVARFGCPIDVGPFVARQRAGEDVIDELFHVVQADMQRIMDDLAARRRRRPWPLRRGPVLSGG